MGDVKTAGILTISGVLAATPFGIPMNEIALGTFFAVVGVCGRASFELQKASEGAAGGIPVSKILGWMGAGLFGAPFVTLFYLVVLRLINVQSDGIVSLGLLFLGFSGPRMVSWLLNTGISLINKHTGLNIPTWGASSQPIAPQPAPGKNGS